MKNYNGLQSKYGKIYEFGCYFLSICCQANYQGSIIELYDFCLSKGWIDEDCTVMKPEKIYWYLTGTEVWVDKTTQKPKGDELFYVQCWYNPRTKFTHFRLPDCDTLKDSVTVKEGYVKSYRIFYAA